MKQHTVLIAVLTCSLMLTACDYDVPITASPTRRAEARLVGNWTAVTLKKTEHMKIRPYDDSNYVISYDGDLFRAHHSDLAGIPLVSVQKIEDARRKYAYFAWVLSDDGQRLTLKSIQERLIPKETKDSATIAKLIESNRDNPRLFEESFQYTRDP